MAFSLSLRALLPTVIAILHLLAQRFLRGLIGEHGWARNLLYLALGLHLILSRDRLLVAVLAAEVLLSWRCRKVAYHAFVWCVAPCWNGCLNAWASVALIGPIYLVPDALWLVHQLIWISDRALLRHLSDVSRWALRSKHAIILCINQAPFWIPDHRRRWLLSGSFDERPFRVCVASHLGRLQVCRLLGAGNELAGTEFSDKLLTDAGGTTLFTSLLGNLIQWMICILKVLGARALNQYVVLGVIQELLVVLCIIDIKLVELLVLDRLIQIARALHLILDGQLLGIVHIWMQNLRCLIGLLIVPHSKYLLRGGILILLALIHLLLLCLCGSYRGSSGAPGYLGEHGLLLVGEALQLGWRLLIHIHHLIMPLLLLMYLTQVLVFVVLGFPVVKRRHIWRQIGGLGLIWLIHQIHQVWIDLAALLLMDLMVSCAQAVDITHDLVIDIGGILQLLFALSARAQLGVLCWFIWVIHIKYLPFVRIRFGIRSHLRIIGEAALI